MSKSSQGAKPKVTITFNGQDIAVEADQSLWTIAKQQGVLIPHLCHRDEPGYRADGNCRACMVEIKGERTLTASCIRKPSQGMVVTTDSPRVKISQQQLFTALLANQPARAEGPDGESSLWQWADKLGMAGTGKAYDLPAIVAEPDASEQDNTHPAIAVNWEACIECGLCVRACREVQGNNVIGWQGRGADARIVFDFASPMGLSTCVACGECVQVCPTGALLETSQSKARLSSDMNKISAPPTPQSPQSHQTPQSPQSSQSPVILDQRVVREVNSVCPYCGVGCQTKVGVNKDNRIVRVDGRDGPGNHNRLCVKGRFGYDYIYHPDRLTKPLIRREDAPPKDSHHLVKPHEWSRYFREASWEEALSKAAKGLSQIHKQHGPNALAGFGSAKGSNEEAYLFQKFIRQGFGTNNVDHCTRLCHASSVAALIEGLNSGAVSAPFTDALYSDCIIVIGARPAENHPVAATFIKNAVRQGSKLIVMDPRGQHQGLTPWATHVLQFSPGADVALLNAMLHVIISENLYNRDFIEQRVEGFNSLLLRIDEFTPEAMAPICGIDPAVIREVARLYATSKASIIFWGMGVSQHIHGTDNARCLIALSLITGQIGRRGTGLHPLRGQNNVQGASDAGLIPMFYPDYQRVKEPANQAKFEAAWGVSLSPTPGLTVVETLHAAAEGKVKAMYIMGENPAMSDPDQTHAREALCHLEHLVVQDIFLTETAGFADVILPSSAHAEKRGTFTNSNREVQMARPAVPLPGEARQDWELIQDLAQAFGLAWDYQHVSEVYTEMASLMPSLTNISWERLEREDAVTYPCLGPNQPGEAVIFATNFPTPSGKGLIVPAAYTPPGDSLSQDYPFVLTTGRLLEHWHTGSMTRRASHLDTLEPTAIAGLALADMQDLGIEAGDMIEVETLRGKIQLAARADADVPQGLVFIPFCFNEAAANFLTSSRLDPFGKIPEFKYSSAKITPLRP